MATAPTAPGAAALAAARPDGEVAPGPADAVRASGTGARATTRASDSGCPTSPGQPVSTSVEYRGWTVAGPAPRGRRGPAWAARDERVRAGLAAAADVARRGAVFTALDTATERPGIGLDLFAAVCRRPT